MLLPPYPEYRDSGISWLGRVPAHWDVRSLGRLGRFFKGTGGTKADEVPDGVPCVRYGDLYTSHEFQIHKSRSCVATDQAPNYTSIRYGDLLFASSGETLEEIGKSAVNLMESRACCGGDVLAFRATRPVHAPFLGYVADHSLAAQEKAQMGRGVTVMHIYGASLRQLSIPLPPVPEQIRISNFLGRLIQRIKRYTTAKERMIERLEEQKQAIIHYATTRGLDPEVPRKPSGVPWLSDIPAHWNIVRLGRLFEQRNESGAVQLPILEVSLRTGVRVRTFTGSPRKQVMEDRTGYQRAKRGDIAYNMMRMWQGAVGVVPEDGLVSPAYVVARPTPLADPRYFSSLFRTTGYRRGVDMNSRGIVKDRNRLYWQDFKQLPAPCPPHAEQRSIVEYVDRARAGIDGAVERARRQIALLGEYRKRLVVEVVTGKLDVRQTPIHPKRTAQDDPDSALLPSC